MAENVIAFKQLLFHSVVINGVKLRKELSEVTIFRLVM